VVTSVLGDSANFTFNPGPVASATIVKPKFLAISGDKLYITMRYGVAVMPLP
jgi:hypothetical protein